MVYNAKLVAVVKCNGRILREIRTEGDEVRLPFGSDYSILFKNLNTARAVVSVSIDGQNVCDGSRLVVDPNSETELKGFMNGDSVRKAFRFIQKTQEIADHRGDRIDDGIIRIEYQFEKPPVPVVKVIEKVVHEHHYHDWGFWDRPIGGIYNEPLYKTSVDSRMSDGILRASCSTQSTPVMNCCTNPQAMMKNLSIAANEGITVKGADVQQNFSRTYVNELEDTKHVIIINLKGETGKGEKLAAPLFVSTKITCSSCGRKHDSNVRFCPNCGTSLA